MNNHYTTIILDIIESKKMNDELRSKYQEKLLNIVNFVNNIYSHSLKENIVFSAGDSIQGLFKNTSDAYECYLFIKYLFYPYKLRCGIGYGRINELIYDQNKNLGSNFIDGDCYHNARIAINKAKINNCDVFIKTNDSYMNIIINQLLCNISLTENELSKKKFDIFDIYNLIYPMNLSYKLISNYYISIIITYLKKNILNYSFKEDDYIVFNVNKKINDSLKDQQTIVELSEDQDILNKTLFDKDLNQLVGQMVNVSRENIRQIVKNGKFNIIRKNQIIIFMLITNYLKESINDR